MSDENPNDRLVNDDTLTVLAYALDALGGSLLINRSDLENSKMAGKTITYHTNVATEQIEVRLEGR